MDKDTLTLTVRLHDPKEKYDVKKSAVWMTAEVERADLALSAEEFVAKYVLPAFAPILDVHKPKVN